MFLVDSWQLIDSSMFAVLSCYIPAAPWHNPSNHIISNGRPLPLASALPQTRVRWQEGFPSRARKGPSPNHVPGIRAKMGREAGPSGASDEHRRSRQPSRQLQDSQGGRDERQGETTAALNPGDAQFPFAKPGDTTFPFAHASEGLLRVEHGRPHLAHGQGHLPIHGHLRHLQVWEGVRRQHACVSIQPLQRLCHTTILIFIIHNAGRKWHI